MTDVQTHQPREKGPGDAGSTVTRHKMALTDKGPLGGAFTECGAPSCDWHSLWHFGRDRVEMAWEDGLTHGVKP
jgi:hypothetical protein